MLPSNQIIKKKNKMKVGFLQDHNLQISSLSELSLSNDSF